MARKTPHADCLNRLLEEGVTGDGAGKATLGKVSSNQLRCWGGLEEMSTGKYSDQILFGVCVCCYVYTHVYVHVESNVMSVSSSIDVHFIS